jgi:rSAM/selenodomain-associated transferase 2
MKLSVIIPALNEDARIGATLAALTPLRGRGHEIIVVDGGSSDATRDVARGRADRVLDVPRGRACQMNAGAQAAQGDVLLFLHADTIAPQNADDCIRDAMQASKRPWGRFDVRIAGRSPVLAVVAASMNWRSRLTGIATGDQGIFVRREAFERVGRFPEISLMEDIVLSRRLKRLSRPICLRAHVLTSGRRWENGGLLKTVLLMWWLRLRFFFGAEPARLARSYDRKHH